MRYGEVMNNFKDRYYGLFNVIMGAATAKHYLQFYDYFHPHCIEKCNFNPSTVRDNHINLLSEMDTNFAAKLNGF